MKQPINFSLAGLVVASVFFPALVLSIANRSPWRECPVPQVNTHSWRSSDGRQLALQAEMATLTSLGRDSSRNALLVEDTSTSPPACIFKFNGDFQRGPSGKNFIYAPVFVDDDTIIAIKGSTPESARLVAYHRHFPEWWWGQFHRAEVWTAMIFGAIWCRRTLRWLRARLIAATESNPRPAFSPAYPQGSSQVEASAPALAMTAGVAAPNSPAGPAQSASRQAA